MRRTQYRRRRRGVVLPASICLVIAGFLIVLSSAGQDSLAERLFEKLAGHNGFILSVVGSEWGISVPESAVYVPKVATSAVVENAESPAEDAHIISDSYQISNSDAPILKSADTSASVQINNETSFEIDVNALLAADNSIRVDSITEAQVLIVHTHGSESYTPDEIFTYEPAQNVRTTDERYNVIRVGDELQKVLEENGVATVHCREIFDSPTYSGSYDRSLVAIEEILEENPSIKMVIDLHRDSILSDSGALYKTACTVGEDEVAQIMFVVGTNEGGLLHDNWEDNLSYIVSLQAEIKQAYPGLMRPVNLRTQRFNQQASAGSMLIEVGSSGNTLSEALASIRMFGEVLANDLTGV